MILYIPEWIRYVAAALAGLAVLALAAFGAFAIWAFWDYQALQMSGATDPLALVHLVRYVERKPDKRRLETQGNQVWLKSEYGYSAVWAPGFERIIAPTHDGGEEL